MKVSFADKWRCLAALGMMTLAGCSVVPEPQADLTRYYVLGDVAAMDEPAKINSGLLVGLMNVELPSYLDKGAVVVRRGEHELVYNDYARWAEPLAANIGRIVRARLLASPRVARVFTEGFPFDQKRDCDVSVRIQRCEGTNIAGQPGVMFVATIEFTNPGVDGGVISRKVFNASNLAWDGRDYAALVQALSQAVAGLGDEVVAALPSK